MGAFLSIPLTTLLAVPLFSSYSTSLNLLFFTLNWYLLLLSHPPLAVEIYGLAIIRLAFFLLPALLFLAFDAGLPNLAKSLKAQGKYGLPSGLGRDRSLRVLGWSVFNTVLGVALTIGLELLFSKVLRVRSLLSVSKTLPFPWKAVQSVVVGLLCRGALQYTIHRFVLHNPSLIISKLHVQWQHSIPSPFAIVAAYDHPVAYLLHHWVPLYGPAMFFRTHLLPFLALLMIVSVEELLTYSGYSVLPSMIMVKGMARRIDNHFLTKGKGNYGSFGAVDWILGTSVGGNVVEDLQKEWDKHNMSDKLQENANDASDLIESLGLQMKNGTKKRSSRKGSTQS